MKKDVILFDFDGTLADTNELIARSYLHVLDQYFPGKYTLESVVPFNGPSLEQVFGQLLPDKASQMVTEYRQYNEQIHDQYIKPFPHVKSVLQELKRANIRLGVVSTKKNPILYQGLDKLGIRQYFDIVLGSYDYTQVKPDPEPVLTALNQLSVAETDRCLMVGDNWQDLESARRAKVTSVFVSWSQKSMEDIAPYQPDKVVDSMIELKEWVLMNQNGGNQ